MALSLLAAALAVSSATAFIGRPQLSLRRPAASLHAIAPVIICPAQFGTEDDYVELKAALEAAGHPLVVVSPLSRLEWLRIVPSAFTKNYWDCTLQVSPALAFYLEAIDKAVAEVRSTCGEDTPITIVGHSIGGWVARGYLAERPQVLAKVNVLATLGSPNRTPPEGTLWATADQTRGLLRSVNAKWQALGAARPPKTLCVIGRGTSAGIKPLWDDASGRSPLLEGLVALVSYLALCGDGVGVVGDGLIPTAAAVVDLGAADATEVTVVELEDCNHAGFVPTPGLSLQLPKTYEWYGSERQLAKWLPELRTSTLVNRASPLAKV